MKKLLLAGGALAALGAVSAQAADKIQLGVSGTLVENLGFVDNSKLNASGAPATTKVNRFHEQDDGTISFAGKTMLENGIGINANWDLYGTAGSQSRSANGSCGRTGSVFTSATPNAKCSGNVTLKRAYVTLTSGAGALILGEREDVTYILHTSAPDVSPLAPIGDGYWYWWVVAPSQHRNLTLDNDSRWDDRGNKVTYVTPAYHGVAAAVSYIPSMSSSVGSGSPTPATSSDVITYSGNGQINGADFGGDAYAGGLAYSDSLRGIAIKADATVLQANMANLRLLQQGVQLSYAGFTLGGSSLIRDVPGDATISTTTANVYSNSAAAGVGGVGATPAAVAKAGAYAGNTYTVGVSYAIGPYSASAAFFHDNSKSVASLNGTGRADSTDVYDIGGAYAASPGVTFRAGVGYVSYKGSKVDSTRVWLNNNDGIAAVTGLKLDF